MVGIQRIYGTVHVPDCRLGVGTIFFFFDLWLYVMFRMTSYGHRLSNGGLTDSHLPLDVPGGSLDLGYLPRDPPGRYPNTRVNAPNPGALALTTGK